MGVIAQDVELVFPELVETDEFGYKKVHYNGLIGVLLAAVQELNAKVEALTPARAMAAGESTASKGQSTYSNAY